MHKAVRNVTRLFERIQDYEKRIVKRRGQLSRADYEALLEALALLAGQLSPLRPAHRRGAAVSALPRGEPPAARLIPDRHLLYTPIR